MSYRNIDPGRKWIRKTFATDELIRYTRIEYYYIFSNSDPY